MLTFKKKRAVECTFGSPLALKKCDKADKEPYALLVSKRMKQFTVCLKICVSVKDDKTQNQIMKSVILKNC